MTQQQSALCRFASAPPVKDRGNDLKRQMLGYNNKLTAVKIGFAPGAEGYVHAHRHSQASLVVDEFQVMVNGETKAVGPGDSLFVRPHEDHGAVCPTGGILIDTFSPAREDFLKE